MEYDTIIHRKADGGPGRMVMVCTEGAGQAGTDGLFDRGRQKGWEVVGEGGANGLTATWRQQNKRKQRKTQKILPLP